MKFNWFNKMETRSAATEGLGNTDNQESGAFALCYFQNMQNQSSLTLSAVFAAVELISNSIASLPIHVRTNDGSIDNTHPINAVFDNNLISKFTLIKQLIVDTLINGNGFALIERNGGGLPIGLTYLPKGKCSIKYDAEKGKLEYDVTANGKKRTVKPQDMIHILKNSLDGVNGKGFLYYASRTLGTANAAENAAQGYFSSGCSVNGILKSSKHLSRKLREDIQSTWNAAHSGTSQNNIAVLPVDLDYIQLSSNANDAQLLQTRLFSVEEIARFFTISPVLLGDLSHSSYSTLEASQMEFLTHTLSPIITLIEAEFNRKLNFDDGSTIDFDETHLLLADKSATSQYLGNLVNTGIMSRNEARHLLGLAPVEGGDTLMVAYSDTTLNSISGNKVEENKEE